MKKQLSRAKNKAHLSLSTLNVLTNAVFPDQSGRCPIEILTEWKSNQLAPVLRFHFRFHWVGIGSFYISTPGLFPFPIKC